MIVMPANVTGELVTRLDQDYPNRLGSLVGPGGYRTTIFPRWALDNGRYKGESWSEDLFLATCDRAALHPIPPRFLTVPDVYLDCDATLREWEVWAPRLRRLYGWPLAFVWQNGCTPELVRAHVDAEVQFIGGDDNLHDGKWDMTPIAAACFRRVHVGRVNAPRPALRCWRLGVESIDGTGWCMTTKQRQGLELLLATMARGDRHLEPPLLDEVEAA